jgi:NAD(P)-dependent dehydrogenase (short-subunit alcohol dehydrogenase family)
MTTVLITGANRGLGLEFCRQYASQGWQVIAGCRNPAQADALHQLQNQYPAAFQIETLDVEDFAQIDALSKKLADSTIDMLINNAGVYDDKKDNGFGRLDYQLWQHSLLVNTLAPVKMVEAFLPQIKRGNKKLIANVSSLMGSITDNGSGGSLYYRSSKAALNAAMKTLSLDLKDEGVGVLILHPGWVLTDMGGPNALIDSQTSVGGMCEQLERFTLAQTGSFMKYDGKSMPW